MRHLILFLSICLLGCQAKEKETSTDTQELQAEYVSPLGFSYYAIPEGKSPKADSLLALAEADFVKEANEEHYIWLGRRTAYLNRYKEAIDIFSEGLEKFPNSYALYRHRGHRYISIRDFDKAIDDFEKAAALMPKEPLKIEADGLPNKLNIPLSSTQFNVYYHLALAHYLLGNYEKALEVYEKCMTTSINDDLICATADWMYMTARRLGEDAIAKQTLDLIHDEMEIIENDSYFLRLKMYQGKVREEALMPSDLDQIDALSLATQGYGLGNWHLMQGDTTKAIQIFEKVMEGSSWSAFGYIAAEIDLIRLKSNSID